MKILLSIKSEYANKIISGEKKYEFRKALPKQRVDSIVLYITSPQCKVIAQVQVKGTIVDSVARIWDITKKDAGISHKKYLQYFKNKKAAKAFVLGEVTLYSEEKILNEFGINSAPQSFVYLKQEKA